MSTTGRSGDADDAVANLATDLASAGFVRVLARADGDALAAAGVLGRALSTLDTPFQVGVAPTAADRRRRAAETTAVGADAVTVLIGTTPGTDTPTLPETGRPAAAAAADVAVELGADPASTLARAGAVAAGADPDAVGLPDDAVERRPGLAIPTTDLAGGLAHSTLVHAPFSGDEAAARALLAGLDLPAALDEDARLRLASAVAVEATTDGDDLSASVERLLRPVPAPDAPFETVGGLADVLAATASVAPGVGVALALGHDVRTEALSAWREHGRAVHATLDDARTSRYDGAFVVQAAGSPPVNVTADLALATLSPEPTVVAMGDGEAAVAATDAVDVREAVRAAATAVDADVDARPGAGYLQYGTETDVTQLLAAFREAL